MIAGKFSESFGEIPKYENYDNVLFLGYVRDEELKSLMKYCKAFIFPSYYEGFGIPPMEALSVGSKAIVSDIPVHHEIYGNSVYYIDPYNADVNLDNLLKGHVDNADMVLKEYSWKKSAALLKDLLITSVDL